MSTNQIRPEDDNPPTITQQDSYAHTMREVHHELPPISRLWSLFLHARPIEYINKFVGQTIARPTALLFGGVGASIVLLSLYLNALHSGYLMQGSETIVGFIIGWGAGIMFDFFRVMFTGKRQ